MFQRELQGHVGDVYSCRLFPSGIVVLSAGADMQIKIWSAETGKEAATIIGHRAGKDIAASCFAEDWLCKLPAGLCKRWSWFHTVQLKEAGYAKRCVQWNPG